MLENNNSFEGQVSYGYIVPCWVALSDFESPVLLPQLPEF